MYVHFVAPLPYHQVETCEDRLKKVLRRCYSLEG